MKSFLGIFTALVTLHVNPAMNQVPAFYQEVDQILWVVEDLDRVLDSWSKLGFQQVQKLGEVNAELGAKHTRLEVALANLGGFKTVWIEPLEQGTFLSEYHTAFGDGVLGMVHRLGDQTSLHGEVARVKGLGVALEGELSISTSFGDLRYSLMSTKEEGKYGLAFTTPSVVDTIWTTLTPDNLYGLVKRQYAFAIADPEPVSEFWNRLGFPALELTDAIVRNREYYGQPADFEMTLGWQRHGSIVYEWCIPITGPTVYQDFMAIHGEGFQHMGFDVQDIDSAIKEFAGHGFEVSMQGAWGEEGKKGSGRFAYIDLEQAGGVAIELLWSYRE